MQRRVGNVTIESSAAESTKFAAPMVLVHGLWCHAAVWRKFMGYLAHRGWTCHAINLRGHGDAASRETINQLSFSDHLSDLQQVVAACDAPPVVVGHDLGGLLALACPVAALRAVVALAPLVPRTVGGAPNPLLASWRARVAVLRSRPLPPPCRVLGPEYEAAPGGVPLESSNLVRELRDCPFDLVTRGAHPAVLVAGERDRICPPCGVERLALRLGAQFQTVPDAGHALPWGTGWETLVAATHRWLVQTLGEPLLLLRGEESE
jgi:pimeloyl-ACP methyl ester carboxylesterase